MFDQCDYQDILKQHIGKEQMKIHQTIKKGFFKYCRIIQKEIDFFWRQILIDQGITSQNIVISKESE